MIRLPFIFLICVWPFAAAAAKATVFMPRNEHPEETAAALELIRYWHKITGTTVLLRDEAAAPAWPSPSTRHPLRGAWRPDPVRERGREPLSFFVGETRFAEDLFGPVAEQDSDTVVVRTVGNRLVLRGGSPQATGWAVSRFLESQGVRWYWPTDLGEHVPTRSLERMPLVNIRETPGFSSRLLPSRGGPEGALWESRNRLVSRDLFHHNLHRIFTEEVFDRHPDFFLLRGGERVRPDNSLGGLNYQICFSNPEAARFAARRAAEFFDAHPEAESFSLGMNDTRPMCGCVSCRALMDPEKVFRDRPDYSGLIFTFMNRTAEALAETHPDKYLGCLAYYFAENVPPFPVHPKVIPYLTADRFQWHDSDFREQDKDLMSRWSRAGPEKVGIYDYYYGSSFVIPRLFTKMTADSLNHAASVGITGFYAELYPIWPLDGPKAWLVSQLLWNPAADHRVLLDGFYRDFFGPAADPMRRFYQRAEEIWANQGGAAYWLKFYHDFTQLELFGPETRREMTGWLEQALTKAPVGPRRERVMRVKEAFRMTCLYADYYETAKESPAGQDPKELMTGLRDLLEARRALEMHWAEVIKPEPLHGQRIRFESRARFQPGMRAGQVVAELRRLADGQDGLLAAGDLLVQRLEKEIPESRAALAWRIGAVPATDQALSLLRNGAFLFDEWDGGLDRNADRVDYSPLFWHRWSAKGGASRAVLSYERALEGRMSVKFTGARREILHQSVDVVAGQLYLAEGYATGRVSPGSRVEMRIDWIDRYGQRVETKIPDLAVLLPGNWKEWQPLLIFAKAPSGSQSARLNVVVFHQAPEDQVFFDNMIMTPVADELE